MRTGDYMTIGKIQSLVAPIFHDGAATGDGDREVGFEVRVVFEQRAGKLFGARHRFVLRKNDGEWVIDSGSMFTEQLTSKSERDEVVSWLDAVRNPRAPGQSAAAEA